MPRKLRTDSKLEATATTRYQATRVAWTCILALLLALSAPAASFAWLHGGHATPDQAGLHEAETAQGHTSHHPSYQHAPHSADPCASEVEQATVVPDNPTIQPGTSGLTILHDLSKSSYPHHEALAPCDVLQTLSGFDPPGSGQAAPSPPRMPPIYFS